MKRLVLALCVMTGCATGNSFNYPPDIEGDCYHARNTAKAKIESKGTSLKEKAGCSLTKHPGERKFDRMWAWFDPQWKQYVGGLCWGTRIEVGCNPSTMAEVMPEVTEHEHAHYWLMTNYSDTSHNPLYAALFYNWIEPKVGMIFTATPQNVNLVKEMVKAEIKKLKFGQWISVSGTDEKGVKYHIDFVATGE
jgi:hypothetical protein